MASITDVARAAGVTPAVVSRLLNKDPALRIRPETQERIEAAVRELDYTPNHAARALRSARVGALGLAVHDVSNPVYGAIIEGAQRAASERGRVLMLTDVDELDRDRTAFQRVIGSGAIDGLAILPDGFTADRRLARAASAQVPTILINDRSRAHGSVGVDDRAGARLATRHLLDLGHRRVALLRPDGGAPRSRDRVRGFADALAARDLTPDPRLTLDGGHTTEAGYAAATRLLGTRPTPTAVFAATVLSAVGTVAAARDLGIRVPDDLSVIGFHDVFFAEYLTPPLTVVRLAMREMGRAAVLALEERIEGGAARHLRVGEPAPRVVERGTTGPPSRSRRKE